MNTQDQQQRQGFATAANQLIANSMHTRDAAAATTRSDQAFPVKVHIMLTDTDQRGLSDVVSWQPHGRCFRVHNKQRFVAEVLPV
jgi:hypothetical protein